MKVSSRELYTFLSRCRLLLDNLSREEIEAILRRSIGSKNMPSLARMVRFLELECGSRTSEKFIRNLILLSIMYAFSHGRKGMTFADLVFQALYVTLSNSSRERSNYRALRTY